MYRYNVIMDLHPYAFVPERDAERLLCFLETIRHEHPDDYPGVNDLRELLARPGIAADVRLWLAESGALVAFAVADPFNNLLAEGSPGVLDIVLLREMVEWAADRLRHRTAVGETPPALDASCRAQDATRISLFEQAGFHQQSLRSLKFRRDLKQDIPAFSLPTAYSIRPIEGEHEYPAWVVLHRAAFDTDLMSLEERAAMAHNPGYDRALDLVCVAAEDSLAGYCFCGVEDGLGFTDPVAVHPAHQRRGLATALLLGGLKALKQKGVAVVEMGTSSQNAGMIAAALKTGFVLESEKIWFSRLVM